MTRSGAEGDPLSQLATVAAKVKDKRLKLGLTVEQLAQISGISTGALSQLERGMGNPSLGTLGRLAMALSTPLEELISMNSSKATGLIRKSERRNLGSLDEDSRKAGHERRLLTPSLLSPLQVIETVLPVGFSNFDRPFRRIGVECVVVNLGRVRIHVGDEVFDLEQGDSLTYDCSRPHWWENVGIDRAVVLGMATPMGP